jgi:hypothetical protein
VDDTDGVLVETPDFSITPNVLERDYTRPDLSTLPFVIGRKVAKMEFTTELRGNGTENSGLIANAPLICRLFEACGYSLTGHTGSFVIGPYPSSPGLSPLVSWAVASLVPATQTFTASAEPTDGDAVTIEGEAYTWKTTLTGAAGQVLIGGSEANAMANLALAINLGNGGGINYTLATPPNAYVTATNTGTTVIVTAIEGGLAGNALTTTYAPEATSHGAWGAATLAGGTDGGTNTEVVFYLVTVATGGVSGTAEMLVTSDVDLGVSGSPVIVTSGTPIDVGSFGLEITPTWAGSLMVSQSWFLWMTPAGLTMQPISDNFQSLTLVLNKDGVVHTMPGALGTFDLTAEAGSYAKIKWTFTGTYIEPFDEYMPVPNYETELPSQVQDARLLINNFSAIVAKFTFNQGNDIQIRPDVNQPDGYFGVRIVSRKPEGGIDPEADLVTNYDFWGQMSNSQCMPFQMAIGTAVGNTVWFFGTNTQYSGLTYQDRAGISTYQAGMRFSRQYGNDEVFLHFA